MKRLLLMLTLLSTSISFSQTKVIAYKSHSGDMVDFYDLVKNRDAEMKFHNLGVGPQPFIYTSHLDSVIYLDDTTTVIVTSQHCTRRSNPTEEDPTVWTAGADTIVNHDVWNQDDTEDIKESIRNDYYFVNTVEEVVFVGFPGEEEEPAIELNEDSIKMAREAGVDVKQQSIVPSSKDNLPGTGITMALVAVVLISVTVYLRNWKKSLNSEDSDQNLQA